jgi:hypothetical protein
VDKISKNTAFCTPSLRHTFCGINKKAGAAQWRSVESKKIAVSLAGRSVLEMDASGLTRLTGKTVCSGKNNN